MSYRKAGDEPLSRWVKDIERRVHEMETGGLRGPGSSFGLPFQIGDWRFYEDGGRLCVLNLVTHVVQCMDGAGDCDDCCLLRVDRYDIAGDYTLEIPTDTALIDFFVLGGGGGGGGGARPDTGERASGGGGGGNGCCTYSKLTIAQLDALALGVAPVAHVGAGGAGGSGASGFGSPGGTGVAGQDSYVEIVPGEGVNGVAGGGGSPGAGGKINTDADGGLACRGSLELYGHGGNLDWLKAGQRTGGDSLATFDLTAGGIDADQGFCSGGGGGGSATDSADTVMAAGNGRNGITDNYMVGNGSGGNGGIASVADPSAGGPGCGGGGGGAGLALNNGQDGAPGGAGEIVVIYYGCGTPPRVLVPPPEPEPEPEG